MFARGSVIRSISKEKNISIEWVKKLNIRPSNVDYKTKNLSGGNQQKVIIAKALESKAKILIFDEPTFGIDIATKADVRRIISELADQGYAIILLTSDIEEALSLADRIAIINNGVIVKIFENTKLTREELISYMGGVAK
jgi:ribose transport system ATP-binding protein